ncbi:MAG: hypothetical protein OEW45_19690 [Deltaproteobacteria bacterium]|nr:hypothetical protein [Deltaproteobacteria bacterium]
MIRKGGRPPFTPGELGKDLLRQIPIFYLSKQEEMKGLKPWFTALVVLGLLWSISSAGFAGND